MMTIYSNSQKTTIQQFPVGLFLQDQAQNLKTMVKVIIPLSILTPMRSIVVYRTLPAHAISMPIIINEVMAHMY
jgi:hypothetical protein